MNTALKTAFPLMNGYAPKEGPRGLPMELDFSNTTIYRENFFKEHSTGVISFFQTVWVDNKSNANPLYVRMRGGLSQEIEVPAGAQGAYPLFAVLPQPIEIETTQDTGLIIEVVFLNVPLAPYTSGPITVNATVVPIARGTYTDFSSTIAVGGTSQSAIPVNASRLALIIGNPSDEIESLWINFTDPAQLGVDSIEVTPGQTWQTQLAISTEEVTIWAATTGHAYTAKELV